MSRVKSAYRRALVPLQEAAVRVLAAHRAAPDEGSRLILQVTSALLREVTHRGSLPSVIRMVDDDGGIVRQSVDG